MRSNLLATSARTRGAARQRVMVVGVLAVLLGSAAPGRAVISDMSPTPTILSAPEANLSAGGVTQSIPLQVPPGRNGMTPSLTLSYASGAGPSPYGQGWDLPIGRIQRRTRHGVLTCANESEKDEFVLMLPGKTIEFYLDEGTLKGYAHIEEDFYRIQASSSGNSWAVWDRSGRKYTFGQYLRPGWTETSGNTPRTGNDTVDRYHQDSCTFSPTSLSAYVDYTFAWELTRIEDPNGNCIDIRYQHDTAGVTYPDVIEYGGNSGEGDVALFTINFTWAARPAGDAPVSAKGGFVATTTQRLSSIAIQASGALVRSYAVSYEDQVTGAAPRVARQSFLTQVIEYGNDGQPLLRYDGTSAANTFTYNQLSGTTFGFAPLPNVTAGVPTGLTYRPDAARLVDANGNRIRDIFDINGDGFPDLVDTTPINNYAGGVVTCPTSTGQGTWNVYLGGPNGFSSLAYLWTVPNAKVMCTLDAVGGSGSNKWSTKATIDIDGDGTPDYIDASTGTWQVYRGQHSNSIPSPGLPMGQFLSVQAWSGPDAKLHKSQTGVNAFGYTGGVVDTRALLDVNGDGLLDVVQAGSGAVDGTGNWKVWINTGTGFAASKQFTTAFNALAYAIPPGASTDGMLILATRDVNRDGLPDQVIAWNKHQDSTYPGAWKVYPNDGRQIGATPELWPMPELGASSNRFALQESTPTNDVTRDFFDINGDGLPDLVDAISPSGGMWQVIVNRGHTFAPVASWRLNGLNTNDPTGSYVRRGDAFATVADVFDVDGDGLVDFVSFTDASGNLGQGITVRRNAGGAWCGSADGTVCAGLVSAVGKVARAAAPVAPDLLASSENETGGMTTLFYRPAAEVDDATGFPRNQFLPFSLWTLGRLVRDDAMCNPPGVGCVTGGSHEVARTFTYSGARLDHYQRVFSGFGRVQEDEIGTDPRRRTITDFTLINAIYRKVNSVTDYEVVGTTATHRREIYNGWNCHDPVSGTMLNCLSTSPPSRIWVRLDETFTDDYGSTPGATRETDVYNDTWWQCLNGEFNGFVAHQTVEDANPAGSKRETSTDYACLDVPSGGYILDRPIHVQVKDGSGTKLQEQWMFYDQQALPGITQGNLTKTESWLDTSVVTVPACSQDNSRQCVSRSATYDGWGHRLTTTDANGHPTTIAYDTNNLYPAVITSPASQKRTFTYDLGCGALKSVTGLYLGGTPSPDLFQREYDNFCRLTEIIPPDDGQLPSRIFQYEVGSLQHPSVRTTDRREPNNPLYYTESNAFTDGLGRVVQEKRWEAVNGASAMVAATTLEYDDRGQVQAKYEPFKTGNAYYSDLSFSLPPAGQRKTLYAYDGLGRVTTVMEPSPDGGNNFRRTADYSVPWQTTILDENYNANTNGLKLVTIRDALGRTVEKRGYDQSPTLLSRTLYTYDALDRLTSTEQAQDEASVNPNTTIQITYDSLGRRVSVRDPDTGAAASPGLWQFGYDLGGNLIYQDDPKANQHVQYCYDVLNRRTRRCALAGDGEVSPGSVCNPAVACSSDQADFTYDDSTVAYGLGKLTKVVEGSASDPAVVTLLGPYDVRGRLGQITKRIHLSGIDGAHQYTEGTTSFTYDGGDHIYSISYPGGQFLQYGHDAAGHQIAASFLFGTGPAVTNVTYDMFGRIRTLVHGNGVVDTRTYWDAGRRNALEELSVVGPGGTYLDLKYPSYSATGLLQDIDDLVIGDNLGDHGTFGYDALGRLTSVTGNPDITESFSYDKLGNITAKGGGTIQYATPAKPHQMTGITGAFGSPTITHDSNGNRNFKCGVSCQTYTYDPWGQLTSVDVSDLGKTVSFLYDYTGSKVAQIVTPGNVVTRYYGRFTEKTDGVPLLENVFVAGLLVGEERPGTGCNPGTIDHLHDNHLGSMEIITGTHGSVLSRVQYGNYGEIRNGFNNPNFTHDFTDYETEFTSGLEYAGARFYDPQLATFLTHDPVRQFANPYSYVGWNPINSTDPTGRCEQTLGGAWVGRDCNELLNDNDGPDGDNDADDQPQTPKTPPPTIPPPPGCQNGAFCLSNPDGSWGHHPPHPPKPEPTPTRPVTGADPNGTPENSRWFDVDAAAAQWEEFPEEYPDFNPNKQLREPSNRQLGIDPAEHGPEGPEDPAKAIADLMKDALGLGKPDELSHGNPNNPVVDGKLPHDGVDGIPTATVGVEDYRTPLRLMFPTPAPPSLTGDWPHSVIQARP